MMVRNTQWTQWAIVGALVMGLGLGTAGAEEKKVKFDFAGARATTVFRWAENAYSYLVLNPGTFDEPITLRSDLEAPVEFFHELLQAALQPRNMYAHLDKDKRQIEIMSLYKLNRDKLRLLSDPRPETLKDHDEVVQAVIRSSQSNVGVLKNYVNAKLGLPTWVILEADASANVLRVFATVTQVKQIVKAIDDAEKSALANIGGVNVRTFPVRYLKAAYPFQLLSDFFKLEEQSSSANPLLNPTGRGTDLTLAAKDTKWKSVFGKIGNFQIQLYLDERENYLVAVAPPDMILKIERLIQQIDIESAGRVSGGSLMQMTAIPLNFAELSEAMDLLGSIFETMYDMESVRSSTEKSSGAALSGAKISESDKSDAEEAASATSSDLGMKFPEAPPRGTIYITIPSKIALIGNRTSNTIFILGDPKDIELAQSALTKLDREGGQLLIEATIAEVALTNEWNFGIDYELFSKASGQVVGAATEMNLSQPIQPKLSQVGRTLEDPLLAQTFTWSNERMTAFLRFLESRTKVNLLSAPRVLARNNRQTAIVFQDKQTFVKKRVTNTFSNGVVQQEIDQQLKPINTGLFLVVTPHLNELKTVLLEVGLGFSEAGIQPSADVPPPVTARTTNVSVQLRDGQTIMIGGLIRDRIERLELRTPLLSELPLIGQFFTRTNDASVKKELVLFVTPKIATTGQQSRDMMDQQRLKHPGSPWPATE